MRETKVHETVNIKDSRRIDFTGYFKRDINKKNLM